MGRARWLRPNHLSVRLVFHTSDGRQGGVGQPTYAQSDMTHQAGRQQRRSLPAVERSRPARRSHVAKQLANKQIRQLDRVVIRFAGDSGDGMQLTGDRFTSETAQLGNDISTLPNFPAEIRAPAGTLPGVSSFQVHFADTDILTPGDAPDVLVAMNPAALKANLADLPGGAQIIVNTDEFTKRNLTKVGYDSNPLDDGSLDGYAVHPVALTSMTVGALADLDISKKDAERAKNMFALGLLSWLYSRPYESTITFLQQKFAKRPDLVAANIAAFKAGWNFGETTEDFVIRYGVKPARMPSGNYRNITGNAALALGIVAARVRSGLPVVLGAYPITPASDILHELSKHKRFGVTTVQAEDEIAAVGVALGASYGGALGVTSTSGPGVALKGETISLAVALELPLLVIDVQRAGPSTGMPTKTEQADLNMALFGRHGDAPVAIIAPKSPADCIEAIEVPDLEVDDPDSTARVLALGWGSTYGPIGAACRALRHRGVPIAQAHLRHLSPMPKNLGDVLARYERVVIPEMNLGQLAHVIRTRYLVDAIGYNQVRGLPFTAAELETMLEEVVKNA